MLLLYLLGIGAYCAITGAKGVVKLIAALGIGAVIVASGI